MKRQTINRVLALSGGLIILTGLFLMVDYKSDFAQGVHEVAALAMIAFFALHLKVNWKPFKSSLGGRRFVWGMLAVFAVSVAIMLATGSDFDLEDLPPEVLELLPEDVLKRLPREILEKLGQ